MEAFERAVSAIKDDEQEVFVCSEPTSKTVGKEVVPQDVQQEKTNEESDGKLQNLAKTNHKKRTRHLLRSDGDKVWKDETLADWPENDFRLWVGNLSTEVTCEMLTNTFSKYASFNKARTVRNYAGCKGFGFVSFSDALEMARAMRECQNTYCGRKRMSIKKSHDLKARSYHKKKKKKL